MLKRFVILGSLVGLGFLISFGIARAIDPPHNFSGDICGNCHMLHNSPGGSLTKNADVNNLCIGCHSSSGTASNKPFDPTDQAGPGVSGTSHSWTGAMPATSSQNNQYGLRAYADLTNAELKARLATFCVKDAGGNCVTYKVACPVCHDPHSQSVTPWDPTSPQTYTFGVTNGRHMQRMANDLNQMCEDCHFYRVQTHTTVEGPGDGTKVFSHPVGQKLSANSKGYDRAAPLDVNGAPQSGARFATDGTGETNPTNNLVFDGSSPDNMVRCLTCHRVHYTDSNSLSIHQP